MWTQANRGRMANIEKQTKRYPTDLTDEEWARIAPFLPRPGKTGRRLGVGLREVLNAIRYIARAVEAGGCRPRTFRPGRRFIGGFGASHAALSVRDSSRRGADDRPRTVGPRG